MNLINLAFLDLKWSKDKPKEEGEYYLMIGELYKLAVFHVRLFKNGIRRGFTVHFTALKQAVSLSEVKGHLRWSKIGEKHERS